MNGPLAIQPVPGPTARPRPTAVEMRVAREVQSHLLPPRSLRLETLACCGRSLPARGVGGDYFDFLRPAPGHLVMALGDISGKGVSAALMMASLQASLRSHFAAADDDLPSLLRSVNRLHFECTAPQHFASLFLADYDDGSRRLRYANCGHNPPLIVHADDGVERLAATATVLGMFETWDCAVAEVVLVPGDTVLLFTDGAIEATNPSGEPYGESRLRRSLLSHRDLPLSPMIESMLREIRSFSGPRQSDDITLVVARAAPGTGSTPRPSRSGLRGVRRA